MRVNLRGWLVCLVLIPAASPACTLKDRVASFFKRDEQPVALRVGDKTFTRGDIWNFFDSRLSDFRDPADLDKVRSILLESMVEEQVLLAEAERLNIQADPQALNAMIRGVTEGVSAPKDPELEKACAESLRVQQFVRSHLLRDLRVEDKECEAYYDSHVGEFVVNDQATVREILVEDGDQAENIRARLTAARNKNFADLARLYSQGVGASSGGVMGTFQRGDLPEEFEKVIFPLAPGTASRIVRSKYGFHIFLVEEKVAAHQQKFYEVKEQIRERLQLEREREMIDSAVASLVASFPVEIYSEALGFEYTGARFRTR